MKKSKVQGLRSKVRAGILVSAVVLAAAVVRAETVALVGGTIHPVSGPEISNGTIVFRDGKIVSVGAGPPALSDAKVVDLRGKHVYPSLLPAVTVLGLVEIQSVRATVDTTELGEINPQARADYAMNFDSELLPVARSGGILVAGVSPTGGIVSGSAAVMRLEGWTREDATLRAPAAISIVWPDLRIDRSPAARFSVRLQEKRRDEAVQKLKEVFAEAAAYSRARGAEGKAGVPRHDLDPKLEALTPAIEGKIPVIVFSHTVAQIRAALAWSKENNIKVVLCGAEDGWRVADEIAKANVPVLVETLPLPRRADEPYDAAFANPAALAKAGVRVAFNAGATAGEAPNARNLNHQAAAAVAYGFPREKAIEAMTLEPARILNVADRLGSLAPGKDATLIVTDGDILDLRTSVVAAYLDGKALDLSDKQKKLYERYRKRPRSGR
jgi:imidazolonepropionase-like amidohydrolase